MLKQFVVKIASEKEAEYILSLAFECGWKWVDDDTAAKPNGQKMKNEQARFLYFGYKGDGLISWFPRVKKAIPPVNVLDARSQLKKVIKNLSANTTLHVGADEVEINDASVRIGCKSFSKEQVLELLELSKRIAGLDDAYIFHANGDLTNHNRRVSGHLLQLIADEVL